MVLLPSDQGGHMPAVGTVVSIDMREFVTMMAGEVARQVSDELKANHIAPLQKEVAELKERLSAKVSWFDGVGATLFKFGWLAALIFEVWDRTHR